MSKYGGLLCFALLVSVIGGCVALNVSLWNECRDTHSFWYCWRVLGK